MRTFQLATLTGLLMASAALAVDSDFSGTLATAAEHKSFFVTLSEAGTVTVKTSSYAEGGLDPALSVFDAAGNLIANNNDGGCANVTPDTVTGLCWDSYISLQLPAGDYQIVLTQSDNVAGGPTLADGFIFDNDPAFSGFADAAGNQRTAAFGLRIVAPTQAQGAPVISSTQPPSGKKGVSYSHGFTATGGTQPYIWSRDVEGGNLPPGLSLSSAGVLSGTPTAFGDFTFIVQVRDARQQFHSRQFTVHIDPVDIQISTTLGFGIVGQAYGPLQFFATGGSTEPNFNWSLSAGALPPGITLTGAGVFGGTPTTNGNYSFTVRATSTNGQQFGGRAYSVTIYAPLIITTSSLPQGVLGHGYGPFSVTATGGSGATTFSVQGLPPGLTASASGQITGTPGAVGTFAVQLNALDSPSGQAAAVQRQLTIVYPSLQISGVTNIPAIALGSSISSGFTATGGKAPYTFAGNGLPAGLSVDPGSGQLTGTPTQAGNFGFSVQVTDAQPVSSAVSVTVSVLGIVTNGPLSTGSTATPYSASFAAAGGAAPYSFFATGLPAGLAMSTSGSIFGTATNAGNFSIVVEVVDSAGLKATKNFTLAVASSGGPLSVTGSTLTKGTVGTNYSATLGANGGTAPYTWTYLSGTLPPGVSINGSGSVLGNPTTAGTFTFTAQATDTAGGSDSGPFTITIDPATLQITTTSFPAGISGIEYSPQLLGATGGNSPYTFAVTSGNLPTGLALNSGQITGKPTSTGTASFTITVTDSSVPAKTAQRAFQITIKPSQADLLISSSSLSFSLVSGTVDLPTPANIPVESSVVQTILNYTAAVTTASPWLTVTSSATTPGTITVALNAAAAALSAQATPYSATIAVTCVAPSPCAGSIQNISVALTVTAPPAQLSLNETLLTFNALTSNPSTPSQSFGIQNKGGGTIGISSVTASAGWIALSGVPTSLVSGPASQVVVTVNPNGLAPGFYRGTIDFVTSAGNASLPVTLQYTQDNASISLNPTGSQFQMQQGGAPGNPAGSFQVSVAGNTTVNFSAAVQPGASWLTLATASGSATSTNPATVNFSINPSAATLAPAAYYGIIRVSSGDAGNAPLDFEVVLNVTPSTETVKPDPQPAGVIFITRVGVTPPSQTIQLFASSVAPLNYQASASTIDGGSGWLAVSPPFGTVSAASPASPVISVNPGALTPGVYRGGVSYSFSAAAVRTVNVTLIVQPQGASAPDTLSAKLAPQQSSNCVATRLVPTQTGLVSNFAQPTAWPTPLSIRVFNDCGVAVGNGQVVATFSNGDPALTLQTTNASAGIYAGTWTPRSVGPQVTITARASAAGFAPATTIISGQVTPNAAPLLTPHGTLHVFAPLVGGSLGPGNIVQIYGENLAADVSLAPTIPLPAKLGGTQVLIGGIPAPLYFVSKGQVNAQIPFELSSGKAYQIVVSANGALTTPDTIQLTAVSPGIAAFPSGAIIAQHLDATLSLVTNDSPAKPGEILVFYLAGLGSTDSPVGTGEAAPLDKLVRPIETPKLTLNGTDVPVLFAGLTPGLVGLYQVNFKVPDNAPDGDLKLVITQTSVPSNTTILPVKK